MRGLTLVLALLLLCTGAAHAHPRHPSGFIELVHLLTEPDHLALLLIPIVIGAGLWRYRTRQKRRARRVAQ